MADIVARGGYITLRTPTARATLLVLGVGLPSAILQIYSTQAIISGHMLFFFLVETEFRQKEIYTRTLYQFLKSNLIFNFGSHINVVYYDTIHYYLKHFNQKQCC